MNKAIVANSIIALASIGTVILLSVNAVDIPEEPVPLNATTTMTTALSQVTTLCSTTNISSTTRAITTTEMTTTPCTTLESLKLQEDVCETEACSYTERIYIPETEKFTCAEIISEPIEEYLVYKPSTKYIHRNSCRWNSGDTIIITNTNDIESRKCTECNPDIEIVNEYIEPEPSIDDYGLTEDEITLLRKIVSYEYGSDWVPVYEKAKVVNGVMNRVYDSRFPDTIYGVLTQSGQFPGFYVYGTYYISDSIISAVDYYFAHPDEFDNSNSWYADGYGYNVFYYQ